MSRKDEAYLYLRDAILSNQLHEDAPISELAISEQLKMSRTPIREALRELESEGLVISYPARGTFVSPVTPYDVEEVYELRALLEGWALERSINRISTSDLEELERQFRVAHQASDWVLFHEADRTLHQTIVSKAGSKRLQDFANVLNLQVERIRRISAQDINRANVSYLEHMEIIRYLKEKDLPRCRDALRQHLKSVSNSAVEVAKYMKNL